MLNADDDSRSSLAVMSDEVLLSSPSSIIHLVMMEIEVDVIKHHGVQCTTSLQSFQIIQSTATKEERRKESNKKYLQKSENLIFT